MQIRSAKNKGRRAAAELRDALLNTFPELTENDIWVTPTGVNGSDLKLSAKALEILPYSFELKNQEQISIWKCLQQTKENAVKERQTPALVFRRNNELLHVVLTLNHFLDLLRNNNGQSTEIK